MVPFCVFSINVYKIGLPFTQTLAHDQHHGFLIAFPNEHPDQDHQSVCLFSQIWLYLIKHLLQLELRWTCSYDRDSLSNVPNILSFSHCLEQLYSCFFNSHVVFVFTSQQQLRSYGDGAIAKSLIRQTGKAGNRSCNPWFTRQVVYTGVWK